MELSLRKGKSTMRPERGHVLLANNAMPSPQEKVHLSSLVPKDGKKEISEVTLRVKCAQVGSSTLKTSRTPGVQEGCRSGRPPWL